VFHSLSSRNH